MGSENSIEEERCWQYEVRLKNLQSDMIDSNITQVDLENIKLSDFSFSYISSENTLEAKKIKEFIEKHEWLGKMPARPTHRFVAKYKNHLAGVLIFATPNSFSHLLGAENKNKEKLISRGACISWSPKSLASWLISRSIDWMIKNTEFRFFTAYGDTAANEIGTIYQACNFIYLGKKSGTKFEYYDPCYPKRGWFNDRLFRKVGQYKKIAKEHFLTWENNWSTGCKIHWENMPIEVRNLIKQASKSYQGECLSRNVQPKHKYVLIKGRTKKETKKLFESLYKNNPKLKPRDSKRPGIAYPKVRGQ